MADRPVTSTNGAVVPESAIGKLAAALSGRLIRPDDAAYDDARKVWNRAIDRHPALIAKCKSTADVVASVNFARDHGLLAAVRGGGHSFPGKSTCDGGLVIDLSAMKEIRVDASHRIAYAAAGLTLAEFDAATQQAGLATTMGTAPPTGIAGLTLGGGLGWLMGKYGLACDNLRGAEVVAADGKVVRADAETNPELLWGLRGGGGNFGVVTSFEYDLHPIVEIVGGAVTYELAGGREVLRRFRDFAAEAPDELTTMAGVLPLADGPAFAVAGCWCGERTASEKALAPLRAFGKPLSDRIGAMSYLDMQAFLSPPPLELASYAKSDFIPNAPDEAIDAMIDALEHAVSPLCVMLFEDMHGAVARVRPTDTAFATRTRGLNMLVLSSWLDAADSERSTQWVRSSWEAMHKFAGGSVYVNYLTDEGEDRVRAAYGPNYARLRALKKRYDPTNLFRLNQNIRPA